MLNTDSSRGEKWSELLWKYFPAMETYSNISMEIFSRVALQISSSEALEISSSPAPLIIAQL